MTASLHELWASLKSRVREFEQLHGKVALPTIN